MGAAYAALVSIPVHVLVTRTPKPGKRDELLEWAHGIMAAADSFPGHLGGQIYPPSLPDRADVVMTFSFDTAEHLSAWEHSDVRNKWLAKAEPLAERTMYGASPSGFESLFGNKPGTPVTPPPRWKTATIIFLALYPFSLLVNWLLTPRLIEWNFFLRIFVATVIIVAYMAWVGVPYLSRWLKPWLTKGNP